MSTWRTPSFTMSRFDHVRARSDLSRGLDRRRHNSTVVAGPSRIDSDRALRSSGRRPGIRQAAVSREARAISIWPASATCRSCGRVSADISDSRATAPQPCSAARAARAAHALNANVAANGIAAQGKNFGDLNLTPTPTAPISSTSPSIQSGRLDHPRQRQRAADAATIR